MRYVISNCMHFKFSNKVENKATEWRKFNNLWLGIREYVANFLGCEFVYWSFINNKNISETLKNNESSYNNEYKFML